VGLGDERRNAAMIFLGFRQGQLCEDGTIVMVSIIG
jgi:hypothetical protein